MANNNSANVSTAKPKVGGAIWAAPVGTALPTSADAALDAAFTNLGFISEDGLKNSNAPSNSDVKEWGGSIVLSSTTERPDTFTTKLLEVLNAEVLKLVYGSNNVTGTLVSGIHVKATAEDVQDMSFVVDMIMNGGIMKRVVIQKAKLSGLSDLEYKAGDPLAYEITLTAYPDANGVTHDEYIKAPSAERSSEKLILGFAINGKVATIDNTAHTVSLTGAGGTITAEVPQIMISAKATISPASGQAVDFTDDVTYTVTAEDGTTQAYTVTVTA